MSEVVFASFVSFSIGLYDMVVSVDDAMNLIDDNVTLYRRNY